jgi:hypothetical protein
MGANLLGGGQKSCDNGMGKNLSCPPPPPKYEFAPQMPPPKKILRPGAATAAETIAFFVRITSYVYSVYTEVDQQKFVEKIRNGDHVFIPIYYVLHEV